MATPKTVGFHTLGCKLNFSETSAISKQFESAGYGVIPFDQGPDICVINTCSVTEFADRKCRKTVRHALRKNPNALIVVTGCYAQLKPKEISEISGVDLVLGAKEKFNMLRYIDELNLGNHKGMVVAGDIAEVNSFESAFSFGDRTRSFLKVQDGCDYKCTFCTIPQARGKSRSATIGQVVGEAKELAQKGIKEIVLTGVNIGDFGNGTEVIEGKRSDKSDLFIDLIRALDEVRGIERFRISSIEPNLCTREIIDFVKQSKRFVPHFHIPLQSGSDKMLSLMKRRYTTQLYTERIEYIRQQLPDASIGVDVIVGFPGETEADFMDTYRFLTSLEVSYLHVFTYSERANTPAANMVHSIPIDVRRKRNEMLRMLSDKKKNTFYRKFIEREMQVLVESGKNALQLNGFTDNYIKVILPYRPDVVNTLQKVLLLDVDQNGAMQGEWAMDEIGKVFDI